MATGDAVREAAKRLAIPLSGTVLDEVIDEGKIRSAFANMGQDRVEHLHGNHPIALNYSLIAS